MKKKLLSALIIMLFLLQALTATAFATAQYPWMNGPYRPIIGDEIANTMPEIYDAQNPEPMNVVLLSPAYKGLIYGDSGRFDIVAQIILSDCGGTFNLSDLCLDSYITDKNGKVMQSSSLKAPDVEMKVSFSSDELEIGDYYLKTELSDENGNIVSKASRTIRKRDASFRPDYYIDENGTPVLDGNPNFFYGMYGLAASNDDMTQNINDIVNTNFEVLSQYSNLFFTIPSFYDAIKNQGIKTHLDFQSCIYTDGKTSMAGATIEKHADVRNVLTGVVNWYKENTGLWGYYLFDEQPPVELGEEIRWNNEIITDADLNHPTWGVTDYVPDCPYGIFTKMVDILGVDPYPIRGLPTDDIAKVGRLVKRAVAEFPNRPIYAVLQAFKWENGDRAPNEAEMRNMAWQAVCEGAKGLDWFSLFSIKSEQGANYADYLNTISDVVGEVKVQENVLLSSEIPPSYTKPTGDWLNCCVKRYNGKTYLFAVNNTQQQQNGSFGFNNVSSAKYVNGSNIGVSGGSINLSFSPLEVKLIEITQAAYSSPEAKLNNISFYNGSQSYFTTEGSTMKMNVPENITTVSYSADISDNASLYINGVLKETTGTLDLTGTEGITVRVVSQDGSNNPQYTYNIQRAEDRLLAIAYAGQNYGAVLGTAPISLAGGNVFMSMIKNSADMQNITEDDIAYCNFTQIAADGTYRFEFIIPDVLLDANDNISNYNFIINVAGQTITKKIQNQASPIILTIENNQGKLIPRILENNYSLSRFPCNAMLAFYGSNDQLIECRSITKYSGDNMNTDYTAPQGTAETKMFIWDKNLVPLSGVGSN